MPLETSIWKVGDKPLKLQTGNLESEKKLEDMIVQSPDILSPDWMLIGRQERTPWGKIIDLLAIAPDGTLVLIELKKGQTPWAVVTQALDYATWVESLEADDVARIYSRFSNGKDLGQDFKTRFGSDLVDEAINESHEVVIVGSSLDDSTERIVSYLGRQGIPINVQFFQVFESETDQLLSRTWLLDPAIVESAASGVRQDQREPWNGEFYVNFGANQNRKWNEARKFGFVSGGGGHWYSSKLKLLGEGDRIWVKDPEHGFIGVARVTGESTSILEFEVKQNGVPVPAMQVLEAGDHFAKRAREEPEAAEYFVSVDWLETRELEDAIQETGMFGNQNTVCRPRTGSWRATVDRLKQLLPNHD